MVEKNEYRVGNYVGYNSEIYILLTTDQYPLVTKVGTGNSRSKQFLLNYCEPIEISGPLLEKCGFIVHTIINEDQGERGFYAHSKLSDLKYVDGLIKYGFDELPDIKYLHQLQNLYRELTNEEIEINITLRF